MASIMSPTSTYSVSKTIGHSNAKGLKKNLRKMLSSDMPGDIGQIFENESTEITPH